MKGVDTGKTCPVCDRGMGISTKQARKVQKS